MDNALVIVIKIMINNTFSLHHCVRHLFSALPKARSMSPQLEYYYSPVSELVWYHGSGNAVTLEVNLSIE
jgi:hypothetical protein